MEMEGRGYSEFLRNSSEEIVLKSLMENPIGISAPSMEMLGFKNISQTLRGDSEDLFNSWLMNGEIPGFTSTNLSHRTRQPSQRMSTELSFFSSQQNGSAVQKKSINDNFFQQNLSTPEEQLNDINQQSLRNASEKGVEAGNLYLAKAWFHSNQPMTRSRSSELRKEAWFGWDLFLQEVQWKKGIQQRNAGSNGRAKWQKRRKRIRYHHYHLKNSIFSTYKIPRKDSEQTKQIEELQKQNEELMEEKERLVEEIERIIAEPCRM